ncbi:hypothetical protein HYALB_00002976 [Hymenoscyphus albidus]|uniref:Kinase-like protein n=1 Tax=Hymenoscyphus albidus TaxID=595503 RepID=A0A9N9LZ90_9HELO|nr:hypothetical protein HYALB_00002976 [Hymenoscyphus albidus]
MSALSAGAAARDGSTALSIERDAFNKTPIAQFQITDSRGKRTEIRIAVAFNFANRSDSYLAIIMYPTDELLVGRAVEDVLEGRIPKWSIPDIHVSKLHFRIYSVIYNTELDSEIAPLFYCEDLNSSNGTYVNGNNIAIQCRESMGWLIKDGDIINIRPYWQFTFSQYNATRTEDTVVLEKEKEDMEWFQKQFVVSERVLGKGCYAPVYLAEDIQERKQLACKIVRSFKTDPETPDEGSHLESQISEKEREKAMREIKILANLSHPHIINITKAFYSSTKMYIFMELASGGDLYSYLCANGMRLIDIHARVIALQIVLAIEYLHSKGIAHRDIKPENILVTNTEFGGRVVLTDFGFAVHLEQDAGKRKTGRMMSNVGTVGYQAPEVGLDRGYTMAADLWSLGVLTACILTGFQEELSDLSQVEINAKIDSDFTEGEEIELTVTAKRFLREILILAPEERLSATEARNHAWFRKPRAEAAKMEERYHKIIRFWKERNDPKVLERLPEPEPEPESEPEPEPQVAARNGLKSRRKFPDASANQYFGLERHLQTQEAPGGRLALLEKINSSGTYFLPHEETQSKFFAKEKRVSGKDIFGMQVGRYKEAMAQKTIEAKTSETQVFDLSQKESRQDTYQSCHLHEDYTRRLDDEEDTSMVDCFDSTEYVCEEMKERSRL